MLHAAPTKIAEIQQLPTVAQGTLIFLFAF